MTTKDFNYNEFKFEFLHLLQEFAIKPKCIIEIGSQIHESRILTSDIDFLCVLGEDNDSPPLLLEKYEKMRFLFSKLINDYSNQDAEFKIVPTFRIEEYLRYLARKKQKKAILCHMIIYRNFFDFANTETPSIYYSIKDSGKVIVGEFDPNYDPVLDHKSFSTRIAPMYSLLLQTYLYGLEPNLDQEVLMTDLYHILEYCVRYISIEFLTEFGFKYHEILNRKQMIQIFTNRWNESFQSKIPDLLSALYRFDPFTNTPQELFSLYKQAMEFISLLENATKRL